MPPRTWSLVAATATLLGVLVCMPVCLVSSQAAAAQPPEAEKPVPRLEGPRHCRPRYAKGTDIYLAPPFVDAIDEGTIVVSRWDVRLLAVYDEERVMLSRDEGRTWTAVLGDPPTEHALSTQVHDLSFDCSGRLHVLRGGGNLGSYDPVKGDETWESVTMFESTIDARLVIDRHDVALVGPDPGRLDQLVLLQRDPTLGWAASVIFVNNTRASWDGVTIDRLRHRNGGRFSLWLTPWVAGNYVPEGHFEVSVSARTHRWGAKWRGHHPRDWPTDDDPVVDIAGRLLELDNGVPAQLLRTRPGD